MTRKVILEDKDGEELVPYTELATNQQPGRVRPDGSSLVVDSNGVISVNGATGTEIGYLSGVTSGIQGQLNANTSLVETTRQNLQTEINTKANSTDVSNAIDNLSTIKADKANFQVVSALPANPDSNTFYFIPE